MTRVLSCIQPTGDVHLGNYLGALRNWVAGQHEKDAFHGIVDLHALTITEAPDIVGQSSLQLAAMLFAVGLDPAVTTVFVQSHVPEHSQLGWIMECQVSFGELSRMTQFKDKSAKREHDFLSAGLFSYPALMAAGLRCSGLSPDRRLVEFIELDDHPFWVATQAHPEFKSRPDRPHPLFRELAAASMARREARQPLLRVVDEAASTTSVA